MRTNRAGAQALTLTLTLAVALAGAVGCKDKGGDDTGDGGTGDGGAGDGGASDGGAALEGVGGVHGGSCTTSGAASPAGALAALLPAGLALLARRRRG